ncbi:uncharacterized protein PV07_02189 [Cladophialophora immunda]|uniref:Pre-mRNA-splicing factor 38B n=1 Tax=Cladophialophora immunda TaxID=569365 RepID=A0A0D2DIH8_9EURO|nr:uncharacterized protein PV07_02189 [Cladophialophora immunda]KIW35494.1 hypothetical protein PV07_02189 [Cladophialophora immunda]
MSLSGNPDDNDDDYVARLLVEDARKSSMRYASQGLSALLPKRPTGAVPKPNTRFLKNLVREADSHNAKLKEKEELEARIRLRKIRDAEHASRKPRQERDDEDGHEQGRKRRRLSDDTEDAKRTRRDKRDRARGSRHNGSPEQRRERDDEDKTRGRRRRHRSDDFNEDPGRNGSRRHTSSRRSRSHSRSRSRSREKREHRERRTRARDTHRHDRKSRRHSPPSDTEPGGQQDAEDRRRAPSTSSTSSDPLASLIGPRPTLADDDQRPQRRGRGFHHRHHPPHQSRSNIDAHFSLAYNPSTHDAGLDSDDLDPDDEGGALDEWTSALSALRDRRAWRAKQAERMKDAGFTEEEITRWKKSASTSRTPLTSGGDEQGDVRDVKWRKKGEEREWDVGKTETSPSALLPTPGPPAVDKANTAPRRTHVKKEEKRGQGVDSAWHRPESAFLKQFKSALR